VFKGKHKNLGISYSWTVPLKPQNAEPTYYWKYSEFWSPCSKTCGGGIQNREAICYKRWHGVVDEEFCLKNAENEKLEKISRQCNNDPCAVHWWIGKLQKLL
jgi:hypothetical protein